MKTEDSYWPACAALDCSRGPCAWVDNCGVGYCAECADDDPQVTIRATSIHSFCPIWLLDSFITDMGIDDKLSPKKRLTDLFYCSERMRPQDAVFTGPLRISESHKAGE